ncbi:MAG: hypothetical protein ABL866_00040 [Devosia sp.]
MSCRLFIAVFFTGLLHAIADASGAPAMPFSDGSWHGDIETGPDSSNFEECWASTTFEDGTTFTLAKLRDGSWDLRLSNSSWRLPHPHRYTVEALVDFYPRVRVAAEVKNPTVLEIVDLDHISLLALIENGHTIELASDGFNDKYELEGSAKVIGRIRSCFADQVLAAK